MCHTIIERNRAHYSFMLTLECNQFALMLCSKYLFLSPSYHWQRSDFCKPMREHQSGEKTYLSHTVCYSNPAVSHSAYYKDAQPSENRKPNEI